MDYSSPQAAKYNVRSLKIHISFKSFQSLDYKIGGYGITIEIKYHLSEVLLKSNRGCPFTPGFRYVLERYFVMSPMPDASVACLSMRVLPIRSEISEILPLWSTWPTISQKMLVGWHIACISVPFLVHRNIPRSESIDLSHDGSFSTSHLGILLSLCTILRSVVNQFIAFV